MAIKKQLSPEEGYVSKTLTIRGDQYVDLVSLSAYNRLMRKKPDSVSGIVRVAIENYLSGVDGSFRKFAIGE